MTTPPGFATVTPYFFMDDAEDFCRFLVEGLGGTECVRHLRDDGKIANAQLALGTATVMVSEAGRGFPAMPASCYLYVEDADAAVTRAVAAGAVSIMDVADMAYGDRQGGVRDTHGNIWWISQRLIAGGYD